MRSVRVLHASVETRLSIRTSLHMSMSLLPPSGYRLILSPCSFLPTCTADILDRGLLSPKKNKIQVAVLFSLLHVLVFLEFRKQVAVTKLKAELICFCFRGGCSAIHHNHDTPCRGFARNQPLFWIRHLMACRVCGRTPRDKTLKT